MLLKLTAGYRLDLNQIARIAWFCNDPINQNLKGSSIAEQLGISYARLQRLWMMASALGLGTKGTWKTTDLGSVILQYDRFLDNLGTLWLLHYIISSNPEIIVWNTMVNHVLPENNVATMALAKTYFASLLEDFSQESFDKHLNKEINSFFGAYTTQYFAELRYLQEESHKAYTLGNHEPVPPRIFCAGLVSYRERFAPRAVTIDVPILANEENSPGRVFDLTERQVRDLLEDVETLGYVFVETRADLDQVRFRDTYNFLAMVCQHYEGR